MGPQALISYDVTARIGRIGHAEAMIFMFDVPTAKNTWSFLRLVVDDAQATFAAVG